MAIRQEHLGTDEYVVVSMRTHAKALFAPVVSLLALAMIIGVAVALLPASTRPWSIYAVVVVALLLFIGLVVVPFLKWFTSTYTVTNRRIITRKGIITRVGHDLPLKRINNVNYERDLLDRILGCGTLIFETAAEAPLRLPDVPDVERVHVTITDLLFGDEKDD